MRYEVWKTRAIQNSRNHDTPATSGAVQYSRSRARRTHSTTVSGSQTRMASQTNG